MAVAASEPLYIIRRERRQAGFHPSPHESTRNDASRRQYTHERCARSERRGSMPTALMRSATDLPTLEREHMMMRYPQYILAVPLLAVLAFASYGIALGDDDDDEQPTTRLDR